MVLSRDLYCSQPSQTLAVPLAMPSHLNHVALLIIRQLDCKPPYSFYLACSLSMASRGLDIVEVILEVDAESVP